MNRDPLVKTRLAELIEEAYPDPSECSSLEALKRAWHRDISHLADEDLDRERILARLRWALDLKPSAWLTERLARLDREAERRKRQRR